MLVASALMGVLPRYATIGALVPIPLVLLRFVQGSRGLTGSTTVGAFYVMAVALISLPAILGFTETAGNPLRTG
jgi:hypothetical protein